MNASELAVKMLEWEQKARELEELELEIKDAVLEIEKTQTVGNVRATYSKGRRLYDYKQAGQAAKDFIIAANTTTKIITDWRMVCKQAEIDDIPFTQSGPSVRIKLI